MKGSFIGVFFFTYLCKKYSRMINEIRNTVLAIINKNNNGYMTPEEFNLFAEQAQLEVFENYFFDFNKWIIKKNQRASNSGYADITQQYEEVIDIFSETKPLKHKAGNLFFTPSLSTTQDDWFTLNRLTAYETLLTSGANTAVVVDNLIDAGATFDTDGINIGDVVINITTEKYAYVVDIAATSLTLTDDIFLATPENYKVLKAADARDIERVSQGKIIKLNASNLTSPTSSYPAYTLQDDLVSAYPLSINTYGELFCQYVRYPVKPNWTYNAIGPDGDPVFNSTSVNYKDFELPLDDSIELIIKICSYAGISIREQEIVQFEQNQQQQQLIQG